MSLIMQNSVRYLLPRSAVYFTMGHRCASAPSGPTKLNAISTSEMREKFASLVNHPIGENKSCLPESLLKRIPESTNSLVPQEIFANKVEILIPLSTDIRLRNKYNSFMNVLRMGRLLEDIDMCAGRATFEHAKQLIDPESGRFPLVVVTALVDRIKLQNAVRPADRDIRLTGYVSWVGRSSLEVTVDVEQQPASSIQESSAEDAASAKSHESNLKWEEILKARLVFVSRHPLTMRSVPFVPLFARPDDPVGQAALREGQRRYEQRHVASQQSLLKTIPSSEETEHIHNLFLQTVDEQKMTFRQRRKPDNAIWISETGVKTALVCHLEERNIYNKIFGGFLMRQVLELAWITVRHFTSDLPILIAVDDLVFKHPVEVGSMLFISSFIVYRSPTKPHYVVRVNVEVVTIDQTTHVESRLVTNTAYFVYAVKNPDIKLRDVYPETYADSMMYIDGKRHYEAVMSDD